MSAPFCVSTFLLLSVTVRYVVANSNLNFGNRNAVCDRANQRHHPLEKIARSGLGLESTQGVGEDMSCHSINAYSG